MLRTMAVLIALWNVMLAAATAILVLPARERLHVGSVGYGSLYTCTAGTLLGLAVGDRVIRRITTNWTIRIGLLVEAGTHLTLALATNVYVAGAPCWPGSEATRRSGPSWAARCGSGSPRST
jgi:uncharacterized membrane protein YfcA